MAAQYPNSLAISALALRAHGRADRNKDNALALELLGPGRELLDCGRLGARDPDRDAALLRNRLKLGKSLGDVGCCRHGVDLDTCNRIVEAERACDLPCCGA